MNLNLTITDMSGATIEHSIIITNFVNMVYNGPMSRFSTS